MDSLFENSGSIIKKLACILFVCAILASIICAIAFGKDRYGDFNFWSFLGILVGGVLGSFISSVFLYAFGDITENIKKMAITSAETAKATKASAKSAEASSTTSSKPSTFSNNRASANSVADTWICKKCGTKNKKGSLYCMDCGEYK